MDATVPLEIAIGGRLSRTLTLWDGSAAQQAARLVPGVPVVAAFHALSAEALAKLDHPLDCDTLICGDSAEAKAAVTRLAEMIPGVRAIDAGPLDNARLLESAAALLISLNLRHKVKESGMRITGLPAELSVKRSPVVALAGGVGAARFLDGLTRVIEPERIFIIGNTADDAEIHGLHISPDLDTVTYTLAGLANPQHGWGIRGDSFRCLEALGRLGADTWFQLGDLDLATHLYRTRTPASRRDTF